MCKGQPNEGKATSLSAPPEMEEPAYLSRQIITCLGNKRALLAPILKAVEYVKEQLGKDKISCLDLFSGSGIVSRAFKAHATDLFSNDLEPYARVINECYLANPSDVESSRMHALHKELEKRVEEELSPGFITRLYAPQHDDEIQPGERVFYTHRNAMYLDTVRRLIDEMVPGRMKPFFVAPLLYEASVHTNTSGVFKGFYKNKQGIGQFGGTGRNALERIMADIKLQLPVLSRFETRNHIYRQDARVLHAHLPMLDFAYLDPPYNQHPYGSNYFMLNLLTDYCEPREISAVSGIPHDWNRSVFNKAPLAREAILETIANCPARFILLSYNSEGFVSREELCDFMQDLGELSVMETSYTTFRASRNLSKRPLHVRERFFLLKRQ